MEQVTELCCLERLLLVERCTDTERVPQFQLTRPVIVCIPGQCYCLSFVVGKGYRGGPKIYGVTG
jgi:hypothetical protein